MQAITLWQPWATLVAEGIKPYEFRGWPPPNAMRNARIAIHAGARPVSKKEVRALLFKLHSKHWKETGLVRDLAIPLLEKIMQAPKSLPLGAVVCTAILGIPLSNEKLAQALGIEFVNDSDRHQHSNYGWPLTEIVRVTPSEPAVGHQGFWEWTMPAGITLTPLLGAGTGHLVLPKVS